MTVTSDVEALYGLLKKAYGAGFERGNGMDVGCRPDDHGDFQEFWDGLGGGDLTSALVAMLDRADESPLPDLRPGVQIAFRQGHYVVKQIMHDGLRGTVELQDAGSCMRENISTVPNDTSEWNLRHTRLDLCPRTGCFLPAGHTGQHEAWSL